MTHYIWFKYKTSVFETSVICPLGKKNNSLFLGMPNCFPVHKNRIQFLFKKKKEEEKCVFVYASTQMHLAHGLEVVERKASDINSLDT